MFRCRSFDELDIHILYDIMALRQQVCMLEFERYYLDCDGYDQKALHITHESGGKLTGYARILPPGHKYPTASIGRVIITSDLRGTGMGDKLMRFAMQHATDRFSKHITISAQVPVVLFYEKLGFKTVGDVYIEADQPHIEMRNF